MATNERARHTHQMADIAPGVRLHYVDTVGRGRPAVLLHGFPQTLYEWRKVIPPLVDAGFRVIAPDYRGAGWSSKPATGYDKRTMAEDVHTLLREHLRVTEEIVLVGHDIGAIVGIAYASQHRDEVSHLVAIDTVVPGTAVFKRMRGDPRGWHVAFHSARDVAEMLVQGRERAYLQHIIGVRIGDPTAISFEDFDTYVRAYESPGAMRAAFELYRTFDEDGHHLEATLAKSGKLATPTLAIGGELTGLGSVMTEMMREVAEHVTAVTVPGSGHWIPEERAQLLAEAIVGFTGTGTQRQLNPASK